MRARYTGEAYYWFSKACGFHRGVLPHHVCGNPLACERVAKGRGSKKEVGVMWIFLSGGFLSIVAHRHKPNHVLVRARNMNHLKELFQTLSITHTLILTILTEQILRGVRCLI